MRSLAIAAIATLSLLAASLSSPALATDQPAVLPPDSTHSGGWQHYGVDFSLPRTAALTCETLLADLPAHLNQTVRVTGRVADVCQEQGCWMVLAPKTGGPQAIRVTMKDHAFSVDKQGKGKEADLEGVLVATASQDGASQDDAAQIQAADGLGYEIVATTVRFRN
ncbi:MAG: DUF4920 domain-containing protein [Oligoflexia bacterium]|nr:DUF4920 domain-containing protein [Oligoflexia bacterium]